MKKAAVFFLFLFLISLLGYACTTGPTDQQLRAQANARKAAEQAQKDSLAMEIKIALSLGMEYYKNEQYTDAIPHFKRIIFELAPEENRAWKYLADSYFRLNMPDSAFAIYAEGIEKFPDISYLHRGLALLYQKEASEGGPDKEELLNKALEEYCQACKLDPKEAFSATQIGRIHLSRASLDSAIIWFEKSAVADSGDIDVWEKLADLYMVRGNWEGVYEAYRNLHRIDSQNAEYALNLGRALANTDKYDDAVATLDKYQQENPEDYKGYQYMGLVHAANCKYDAAQEAFVKAEKIAPDNVKLLLDMADTYVEMRNFRSAKKYLGKARSIDKSSCQAIVVEGNICVERVRAEVPPEGLGAREKLKFECCYRIYKRAIREDCDRWADIARMKMRYLDSYMPTAQEKKEFYFINPELEGKICD